MNSLVHPQEECSRRRKALRFMLSTLIHQLSTSFQGLLNPCAILYQHFGPSAFCQTIL